MKILRHGLHFSLVGAIQLALDSTTYIVLTFFGASPIVGNISGRVAGALLGFWLNGRMTFSDNTQPHLRLRLARYLMLWTLTTTISTTAMVEIASHAGLSSTWWCKPLVECTLGLTSFLLSRHWVYRH